MELVAIDFIAGTTVLAAGFSLERQATPSQLYRVITALAAYKRYGAQSILFGSMT